jgi:hypothetical protein
LSQGFLASMVRARSSIRGRPFFAGFMSIPSPPRTDGRVRAIRIDESPIGTRLRRPPGRV